MNEASAPLVFLVAGEPSGDTLGARLMASLKELTGDRIRFSGVGGPQMQSEGLNSLFPIGELSVMGLAEVLPRLPRLAKRLRQTRDMALKQKPDVVVTIDSPGFCFRLAKRLKGKGMPLVHYVAPSVWAWKPGRAKEVAGFLDHLLALLPFEPPYFEKEGLACSFVGHPVIESGAADGDGTAFRRRHNIPEGAPLLCVLPGSRNSETKRLLPVFGETVGKLYQARRSLQVVLPTVDTVADEVEAACASWPVRPIIIRDGAEKYDAFAAADVALAASGTVSLELSLAGTASVIAYRLNPLTAFFARRLLKIHYASLVNILLDREVVPEHLQEQCRPDTLATAVGELLDNADRRLEQLNSAAEALAQLGQGGDSPSKRAAKVVLSVIRNMKSDKLEEE